MVTDQLTAHNVSVLRAPGNERSATEQTDDDPLFRLEPARGECHVICFDPRSHMVCSLQYA